MPVRICIWTHGGWFRVLGYGLRWVDHRHVRPLFSERNGHKPRVHIGPFCFVPLKP